MTVRSSNMPASLGTLTLMLNATAEELIKIRLDLKELDLTDTHAWESFFVGLEAVRSENPALAESYARGLHEAGSLELKQEAVRILVVASESSRELAWAPLRTGVPGADYNFDYLLELMEWLDECDLPIPEVIRLYREVRVAEAKWKEQRDRS